MKNRKLSFSQLRVGCNGEGATANFRVILDLAALTDITVSLPRKNYTRRGLRACHIALADVSLGREGCTEGSAIPVK
jgi:hypothetical protein